MTAIYESVSEQVDMLSREERIFLLNRIMQTLTINSTPPEKEETAIEDEAFGLWKDYDITKESLRQCAWRNPA